MSDHGSSLDQTAAGNSPASESEAPQPSAKAKITDLAILGGPPAFEQTLHVGRPNLGNREHLMERINDILDRRWFTNQGPYVRELELTIASKLGVKHCIATSNGTVALEIAIRALGLTGEVLTPSFTFVATAHALQWQEITPVFCDIEPDTHNIDPRQLKAMLTPRTTGILAVHLWGRPCHVKELQSFADHHNLKLLYDASHAFGCSFNGRMLGSFGSAEVFSFHATKFINTFEGGAIATNDTELAERIRLMKNFGFTGDDAVGYIGTNGKMSEISAAMGLTSLDSMDKFLDANRRNYNCYRTLLEDVPGLRILIYDESAQNNYQYVVIEVNEATAGISRDDLVRVLQAERIRARRYFYPGCHNMEPYRSYQPHAHLLLPQTERIARTVVCLPTGETITESQVARVCEIIRFSLDRGHEVSAKLPPATTTIHQ